jgi:hypothetical protein
MPHQRGMVDVSRWRDLMANGPDPEAEVDDQPVAGKEPSGSWHPVEQSERERPTGKANRLAVTALICACCIPFLLVGGILGTVFGLVALDEIEESDGAERGRGIAQGAVGLGVLNVAASCVLIVLLIARVSS